MIDNENSKKAEELKNAPAVQPIDNLGAGEEVSNVDVSLMNTYTLEKDQKIEAKSEGDNTNDQNLMANGINFKVVPEAEEMEIDAEAAAAAAKEHHKKSGKKHLG